MASQATQTKELFNRSDIRTMKKDLKKLREDDVLKEREKISSINISVKKSPSPYIVKKEDMPVLPPTANIDTPTDDRMEATEGLSEQEKENIFLLKSKRLDLAKQLDTTPDQSSLVTSQKNNALEQQKSLQEKLSILMQLKEEKENELKGESQNERAKDILEEQVQNIEKRRWQVERDLKENENQIQELDSRREKFGNQENVIKAQLSQTDDSLKTAYSQAKEGIAPIKSSPTAKSFPIPKTNPPAPYHAEPGKNDKQKEYTKNIPLAQKSAFAKTPATVMEKLEKSMETENKQRRKFMEDVEKWAQASKESNKEI